MNKELILSQLAKYVIGKISLSELEKWILSNLQDAQNSSNEEIIHLFDEADALLLELGEGVLDEREFMDSMVSLVRSAETIRLSTGPQSADESVELTGSSISLSRKADFTGENAQIRLHHVFA